MKRYRLRVMRTKSLLWVLLAIMVSTSMVGIGKTSPKPTISVHPHISTAEVGETFAINVTIDVIDLQGYEFKLGYNTTILDAETCVVGDFFPDVWDEDLEEWVPPKVWSNVINEVEGYAWVVVTTPLGAESVDGSGTLATINFTVLGLGESDLDLLETDLYDSNAEEIPHDVVDGYFRNIEVHDTAVTSVTTSPSAVILKTLPSSYMIGLGLG